MILQALADYYDRKAAEVEATIPPYGWVRRPVDYALLLTNGGECLGFEYLGTEVEGFRRGVPMLVPAIGKQALKHNNSGKDANLLWDGARFVLGRADQDAIRQASFIATLDEWFPGTAEPGIRSIRQFVSCLLNEPSLATSLLERQGLVDEFLRRDPIVVFRLQGAGPTLVHEQESVRSAYAQRLSVVNSKGRRGRCLLTGLTDTPVIDNETVVKGVRNAQTSGANIVSFNAAAFVSYGHRAVPGDNAPISRAASFAYTTALNHLLQDGSPNRVQIGDATTVIWTDRRSDLDEELAALFGDDPDAHVQAVRNRLDAVHKGLLGADDSGLRFFVLGLAPNAARIAVRFWLHARFDELGPRILQHFNDLRIVPQFDRDPVTPSMFRLLTAIAPQGKADHIPPRLAGEWIRAILEGSPYPTMLLNAAVTRCRAEQSTASSAGNVTYVRAAILKACINREHRRRHGMPADFDFIEEGLDVNQNDPAYRLGRLFAVLERIQSRAQPGINATIRDRYYGAASTTPVSVFPTLLRLKNAHLKKLAEGEVAYFERLAGEIFGSVEQPCLHEFPRHLDLHAQALFALGYYHQRQSFYTPKHDVAAPRRSAQET